MGSFQGSFLSFLSFLLLLSQLPQLPCTFLKVYLLHFCSSTKGAAALMYCFS
jgi:hypothetical protein